MQTKTQVYILGRWIKKPKLLMQELLLHQTLDDRNNPDEIEEDGPFICRHGGTWLGKGYYFWDTHIELAHWWGITNYSNGYVICQAYATITYDNCWDLHGNGSHRIEFKRICDEIVANKLSDKENLIVAQVIEYLKKKNLFKYQAVRALGNNSINKNNDDFITRIPFKRGENYQFLDLLPPIQLCLLTKKALSLRSFSIVYPQEYIMDAFA